MFALPNLSAQIVEPCVPWQWTKSAPPECVHDKKARDAWACSPTTHHQIYSAWEGQNSSLRVSENNPPAKLHQVPIDYDIKLSLPEVELIVARLPIKPNWLENTISGNWRAVWLLERPIPLASIFFARHVAMNLHTLLPIKEFPGMDENALSFSRYFTNSGVWKHVHDVPVPWTTVLGWLVRISDKHRWSDEPGVEVDLRAVAERLKEKYPRFVEWEGEFKLGMQGPSFWVEGSTSPKSAIVREKGMGTFSAHAHKSYFTWGDLCGHEWLKQYETNRIGAAVQDIYYDDKQFFILSPTTEKWLPETKENVLNELIVRRGLSKDISKKTGRKFSEVDEAMAYIRHSQRVKGAASFAFHKKGLMEWNGDRYLNIHTRDVLQPSKDAGVWGPDGNFRWLSMYLDQYFVAQIQLLTLQAWLSRFYGGCYNRAPRGGQNLFIGGPVNVGKTFLSRAIIGRLVGGYAECKDWITGKTVFNDQLFDSALWVMDDGSLGKDPNAHKYYTEMMKVIAANPTMTSHAKFGKPSPVGWQGRFLGTLNDDPESLGMVPRMDMSNREKLIILRAGPRSVDFPDWDATEKILALELPFFARYLLDYQIPPECLDNDPRFGVKKYQDSYLTSRANLGGCCFIEIFQMWIKEHFRVRSPKDDFWIGTAFALRQAILQDPAMTEPLREFKLGDIKKQLIKMSSENTYKIEVVGDEELMEFKIWRKEPKPALAPEPLTTENSKFAL